MGVKSTIELTRTEAESLYVTMIGSLAELKYKNYAKTLNNTRLENALENMNDELKGGEGFSNFSIKGD